MAAEEAQRGAAIRAELQRLGVAKSIWLTRPSRTGSCGPKTDDWWRKTDSGEQPATEFLAGFVQENPEFLPARIAGGTGMTGTQKSGPRPACECDRSGQDPPVDEQRRNGAGATGDLASRIADAAGA